MLHLIPAPLHRAAYRLAHALRLRWWRIRKPRLAGCRVLVLDGVERVLLIRHSYGSGKWMLPGGGLNRSEAPLAGAQRELREETGCRLIDPVDIGMAEEHIHSTSHTVHIIAGNTADTPMCDGREIIAAQFFALDALPGDMPQRMRDGLPGWITAMKAARLAG